VLLIRRFTGWPSSSVGRISVLHFCPAGTGLHHLFTCVQGGGSGQQTRQRDLSVPPPARSNPVDWWEWGTNAFEEAKQREIPALLSVGYAAWQFKRCLPVHHVEPGAAVTLEDMRVREQLQRETIGRCRGWRYPARDNTTAGLCIVCSTAALLCHPEISRNARNPRSPWFLSAREGALNAP